MAQPYVGEIRMFAGNFAPVGWMFCSGQLLPISENETLFQLIGTTYGGDGESTFALPDLQSRTPIHMGTGPDGTTGLVAASTVAFGLRSPGEQNGLVAAFARWLHSLDGPTQILVRAQRVDLSYLAERIETRAAWLPLEASGLAPSGPAWQEMGAGLASSLRHGAESAVRAWMARIAAA